MRKWKISSGLWVGIAAYIFCAMLSGIDPLNASPPPEIATARDRATVLVGFAAAPMQLEETESEIAAAEKEEGVPEETGLMEEIFHWFNFLLIVGGIGFLVKKVLAPFLKERGMMIREDMDRSAKALADATQRLAAVEDKLKSMDEEMAALRQAAFHESAAERQRIEQAAAADAAKVLTTAEQEIEAAVKTARQELKIFTSELALQMAEKQIRDSLTPSSEQRILRHFVEDLSDAGDGGNGKKSAAAERKTD